MDCVAESCSVSEDQQTLYSRNSLYRDLDNLRILQIRFFRLRMLAEERVFRNGILDVTSKATPERLPLFTSLFYNTIHPEIHRCAKVESLI